MMKKIIILFCLLPLWTNAESLRLCQESDAEDPKLHHYTVNNVTYVGKHAAIAAQALTQLQYQFVIDRLPWKRCTTLVEMGVYTAAIGMGWTAERSEKYVFPPLSSTEAKSPFRLSSINYPVYVHADSQLKWDGTMFSNVEFGIAAPKGYVVEKLLRQMNVLLDTDVGVEAAFSLLVNHRLDGLVLTENAGDTLLAQQQPGTIRKLEPYFYSQPTFVAFSQKQQVLNNTEMLQIWQQIAESREAFYQSPD